MPSALVSRRPIPGSARAGSVLGLTLDAPRSASPPGERATVAVLRTARARGVTVFDAAGARHPELAERWIAAAFPEPDPNLIVVVGLARSGEAGSAYTPPVSPEATGSAFRDRLRASLEDSRRRLEPQRPSILELAPEARSPSDAETATLREVAARQGLDGGMVALGAEGERTGSDRPTTEPELWSVEGSLLARAGLERLAREGRGRNLGIFVRDPFAGGRLDGQRFALGVGDRSPTAAPKALRSLHQEFEPVLRLSFLTRGGKRTLLGASLRYLLDFPSVVSVLVPVPVPERLEAVLSAETAQPLDASEREELGRRLP